MVEESNDDGKTFDTRGLVKLNYLCFPMSSFTSFQKYTLREQEFDLSAKMN